jgi:8-oxo-dGTP pyrophosphatase MutT (NUDIX family)
VELIVRPAVRIVCLDAGGRVLLLCWRDPADGSFVWEPPGGGIEPGETPLDAARRELLEETGLPAESIVDSFVTVERDVVFNHKRSVGPEAFFVARFPGSAPELSRAGLMVDEQENLRSYAWLHRDELSSLDGRLEPPSLASVVARFDARWLRP